jgi:hypothetical protein
MNDKLKQIETIPLFSCPVFIIDKPEFLEVTRKISKKFIAKRKNEIELNPNYPVYMTESINFDPEMLDFANFVAQSAWDVLDNQGYAMDYFQTYFTEMWCQEHHEGSSMDRHIHGNGSVISGFYFLNCPDDAVVVFHDPRDAKVITNLPEKLITNVTHGSNMVNFPAKNGRLMFSNSWLPHSFNKVTGNIPLTFIHFNIAVAQAPQQFCPPKPQVEVI